MDGVSQYIAAGTEKLHYLEWGSGKKLLLAFHGYGNNAWVFLPFVKYLTGEYTILSFDLPYHGNSKWTENVLFKKQDLMLIVKALMKKYKVNKFSLLGYSMGGRVCVSVIEHMPESIDKVVLMATDGLEVNWLYYFSTRTFVGKRLFRNVLGNPARYFKILDWLKEKNRLEPTRHKFAMYYLQSAESRKLLLQVWPGMSDLVPKPAKIKRIIKQNRIPVTIFMGLYDRIMPPRLAEKFSIGLDTVKVYVLERGHRVFDSDNARQIAEHLL